MMADERHEDGQIGLSDDAMRIVDGEARFPRTSEWRPLPPERLLDRMRQLLTHLARGGR
jgi:hypothetical protein